MSAGQIVVCQINAVPGIFPLGRRGDPRCTNAIEKQNVLYFLSSFFPFRSISMPILSLPLSITPPTSPSSLPLLTSPYLWVGLHLPWFKAKPLLCPWSGRLRLFSGGKSIKFSRLSSLPLSHFQRKRPLQFVPMSFTEILQTPHTWRTLGLYSLTAFNL